MAKELFENIQCKKQKLYSLLSKAKEYHWLSEDEFTKFTTKIDNDVESWEIDFPKCFCI